MWGGFNWGLEATNQEAFCISCHEMKDNVYQEYKKSVHYRNRSGVQASCPDCHVPRSWDKKVIRKIKAVNELYHAVTGSIDTREKFVAKRAILANDVWLSMRKSDSRECRNCHNRKQMDTKQQTPKARVMHQVANALHKTCIDCHQGIAHQLSDKQYFEKTMDEVHEHFEKSSAYCGTCHEGMTRPADDDQWN